MMSHSEGKAEVQVTHPGLAFPFATAAIPPHPHINQWCRFSIPERLPLKPFRQDRFNRLPLPPSIMATSKVVSNSGAAPQQTVLNEKRGVDPFLKIQQLEKSLAFVQENHAIMLKSLHEEIEDLKLKNRELLFELVTGVPALPKEVSDKEKETSDEQHTEAVEKLEKEIRKLRSALRDAAKVNSSLSNQVQDLKRDQYSKHVSRNKNYNKTPPDSAIDDGQQIHSPNGSSPQMEDYSDTLRQIQRASNHRNGKREDRRNRHDDCKLDWSDSYVRNGNGYRHHHNYHHHQPQKSPRQQHQPRLPRLPLRNQQNYSHQQYEIQYHQRSSNTLPALKQPLVPVVDHRLDKSRKSRGPRLPPPKIDQVTN
ncbi:uncharacterized protein [Parasteatoda tepidariorum]|uniref:uncharacterized protein n=1 Tax=Parasteatoda tepidariorum TaxID=114398 RepID=UPI00077FBB3F|nr:uncharacterized protein LOC107442933 [Parasteatoda tepidariorum]XP_015912109.1 uncharacterized protein LOC107442933 [Parasteatoda tepidariorum]XP_042906545.1 uncharacterized protein LOC107442933 [Parasteatoda tepidariorum]XP_042906546.1 uncharacterized protein LOC107442933 [Parasteatoda tepidariorum]